jgi:hypothetical protein
MTSENYIGYLPIVNPKMRTLLMVSDIGPYSSGINYMENAWRRSVNSRSLKC